MLTFLVFLILLFLVARSVFHAAAATIGMAIGIGLLLVVFIVRLMKSRKK